MAVVGDYINLEKIREISSPYAWRVTHEWSDTSFTVYICSPSFVVNPNVSSVALRSNWVNITAYYYNGSSWVQAYAPRDDNGYTVYYHGKGSSSKKFYHNRDSEGTTSGDNKNYHLWKYDVQMRGADGSAHGYFSAYIGGTEMVLDSDYNSLNKNQYIKCCRPDYWTKGGTYADDNAFLSHERPSTFKGTPISISSGTAAYVCATSLD